jgi:DNA-binding PadR family transcriptional regulator
VAPSAQAGNCRLYSWRGRFFGAGQIGPALLSLVAECASHGYELMKKLEERAGGIYRASAGTVYPRLQLLEDEGLISQNRRKANACIRLTDAGRRKLERLDEDMRHICWRARRWDDWRAMFDPDAAEIRGPAERLVKAAFRVVAGGFDEARRARVREILERALHEISELGQERTGCALCARSNSSLLAPSGAANRYRSAFIMIDRQHAAFVFQGRGLPRRMRKG